jgi:hypothetical protein
VAKGLVARAWRNSWLLVAKRRGLVFRPWALLAVGAAGGNWGLAAQVNQGESSIHLLLKSGNLVRLIYSHAH